MAALAVHARQRVSTDRAWQRTAAQRISTGRGCNALPLAEKGEEATTLSVVPTKSTRGHAQKSRSAEEQKSRRIYLQMPRGRTPVTCDVCDVISHPASGVYGEHFKQMGVKVCVYVCVCVCVGGDLCSDP